MKLIRFLMLSLLLPATASAQGFLVDIECWNTTNSPFTIQSFVANRAGQTFVATTSSLNRVQLYVWFLQMGPIPPPSTVELVIRSGGPTGPVLGTSAPVTVDETTLGETTFTFPASVGLVPGSTYMFEPRRIAGTGNFGLRQNGADCPNGSCWYDRFGTCTGDFAHRIGREVPVPAAQRSWGSVKFTYR